ncbi:MAG TPA: DUF6025 family protein [Candidatus Limnocylindrales bacterium]|nr:DUF6025 family protein [Candidatus Limnocylindrales bacterium]
MTQPAGLKNARHQAFLTEAGLDVSPYGLEPNVGRLLDAIRRHSWLHPLRGGRIGNWSPIWSGWEPLAHNRTVTVDLGVARPIVGTVSFTETADLSGGDVVHRPASVYRTGSLEMLALTTPVGVDDWLDVSADQPRFVPWMWGVVAGKPVHLAHLHAAPTRTQAPVPVIFEAEVLWRNEKRVRPWLTRLWRSLPEGDLDWLFARGVHRDGTAAALRLRHHKPLFELSTDDGRYWSVVGDADDLTRVCLLPYQVVACSTDAEALVRGAPQVVPLLPARLVKTVLGYLGVCGEPEAPSLFVEWAAPPRGKPGQRSAERVMAALARANRLPPLPFITLPMTPVLLMPSTAAPDDAAAIALFLEALRARTGHVHRGEMEAARAAYRETQPKVSALYRSRFGGPVPLEQPGYARAGELPEVRALTLAQAGLAVATLLDAWRSP